MESHFLDTLTLGTLLAPVAEEEFLAHYWEQAPLVVHRGDASYYGSLFTLEDFDREIASSPASVHTAEAKNKKHTRYEGKTSLLPIERILADMRDGATVLLGAMNEREPKLSLLCRVLEQQLSHRFQTNVYLTPPRGQGFTPHWDNHDVFILQVAGSKHWKVEKQRRKLPGKGENMSEDQGRILAPDAESFTLNQGDLTYIPRGFVHAAECGLEPSLHITLGITIYSWEDILYAAVAAAVDDEQLLRHALPLGFMRDGGDALVKGAMAALRKTSDETYLGPIVDRFRDELLTKSTLDISGQVAAFFQAVRLKAEDKVGPRPGIVYRLYLEGESVRVNFGGRTITFPNLFKESLEFSLIETTYAIRDVAGELEENEKIVFVERLMQEGLLIRK